MLKQNIRSNTPNVKIMLIGMIILLSLLVRIPESFAATITLDEPLQECFSANRSVSFSWTSDISGNPTYHVMRKLVTDPGYAEIGVTDTLSYSDNNALSDKSYNYRIKAVKGSEIFSNAITAAANYCPAVFSETGALCKANGPHNNLTWASATGNISKYEILRKNVTIGEMEFAKIGETVGNNYDDGPNIIGTDTYSYIVRSVWQDGTFRDSASVSMDALACPAILNTNATCYSDAPGGQKISLSWNSLMGVERYEIYRKAQSDLDYSLLANADGAATAYVDNLVESMPLNYWQSGNITYFIKAVWIKDLEEIAKNSESRQVSNYHCTPFMSTSGMCDVSGNPEMHLRWTKIMNSDFYNLFRNDANFLGQYGASTNSFIDYLSPADCPGGICSQSYKVVAGVTGYPNFTSNTATQSIDCATIVPPSPTPELNEPELFCDAADSRIRLSWTPSENTIYYTLYRNGSSLLNLANTTYIDSGVEAGSEYTYYVIANGREGTQTAPSMAKTIIASNCIPPTPPVLSLSGSCVLGNPKITLSWSSTSNTLNYEIRRGLTEAGMATKAITSNTTYTWNDTDSLNPTTTYYYQVIANGVLGVSPGYSSVQFITTNSCLPTLPVVSLSNSCSGGNPRVAVSWTSNDANTQNYKVFREDLVPPIAIMAVGGTYSVIDPNILLGTTTYRYRVTAAGYNPGQETSSAYQPVTTSNCTPPGPFTLTDPPNASCQGPYPKVQLNWTNSVNATSYSLVRSVNSPATVNSVTSPYNDLGQGNVLTFDGSNDYLSAGTLPDLDMTTNDFTVEVWARANGGTYGRGILNKGGWGSTGYYISEAYSPNNRYYFGVRDSAGYKTVVLPLYETWGWTHIVGIKTNNHIEAWVNGTYVGQYNGTIGSLSNPAKAFEIGRSYNPYYLNGSIGEVRVYRRALTSTEVVEHKNGIYNNESDLAGLWYFDEGGGQIASDSSNNGRNVVLGSTAGIDSSDPAWGSGILAKTNYSWRVDATSPGGSASSNTTAPFLTPECAPQKSNLVLSPLCISNKAVFDISWPYSIDTVSYEIYRNGSLVKTASQSIDPNLRKWTDDNAGAGLIDSTNYTYYIKSVGSGGQTSQSADRMVTTSYCAVLPAPVGLSAAFSCTGTPASTPKATLSWNSVSGATSYDIYRNGLFLVNKTALTHEDTTITVNTLYDYTVRAKNTGGESPDSNIASIGLGQYCTPQKPIINISAGCSGGNPANNINWSGEAYPNTAVYNIYRGVVNDFTDAGTVLIDTIDKATEPAFFAARMLIDNPSSPPLLDETAYYYWVQAIGPAPANYTTLSDGTNIVNLFCGPPLSTNTLIGNFLCSGTPPSNPYVSLSWNAIWQATSYDIYRNGIFLINVTTLTHNDNTISVNAAYDYTVRGKNANGQGTDSNVVSIGSGNYCTPAVPAINPIATVCEINQSKNTISWTDAMSNNTDNFEIYRSTDSVTISNFESATFTPPGWLTGGNANWFRTTIESGEGIASAASGVIGNNQSTFLDYDITVSVPSALRFYWKISSENNYDFLLFCLDNDGCTRTSGYRNRISGISMTSFAEVVVPIGAGAHSFRWVYAKDGSAVSGSDKGWIDNVRIVSIDSATLLQTVDKNTLSWTDSGGLAPLTDYLYWIKTNGPTGLFSFSARPIKTLSCGAMPQVTNLNASFACSGAIPYASLAWDSVLDATSYNIYRDGSYLTSRATNFYDDPGIAVNTAYSYVVRAENDAGEGADSNAVSIALGNYCVPFTPVIDPIDSNCALNDPYNIISWSDEFPSGTQKYEIYRNMIDNIATASIIKTLDKTVPADLLGFNSRVWKDDLVGLQDLQMYYYWIKSTGPTSLSSTSNSRPIETLFCGVPGVSALVLGSTYCDMNAPYADLSWTAGTNAYSYNLYRNNASDSIQSVYPTVRSPLTDSGAKALQFDGVDDYVIKNPMNNFPTTEITAEFWMRSSDATKNGTPLSYAVSAEDNEFSIYNYKNLELHIDGLSLNTGVSANDGVWHHIAVTWQSSDGKIYLYKDGIPAFNGTLETGEVLIQGGSLVLGQEQDIVGGSFDVTQAFLGSMDEVRIYSRALSASEISEHFSGVFKNELGLISAWHFDEKDGTDIIDSSSFGNNGRIAGPEWIGGKVNYSLDFGGVNGYVQAPSFSLGGTMTIEAWVYSHDVHADWARVMDFGNGSNADNIILNWRNTSGTMAFESYQGASGSSIYTSEIFPEGQWVHVAASVDAAGSGSIYWNGVLKASGAVLVPNTIARTKQFIGKSNWSGDDYFNGKIDEIRIYNRKLSQTEIQEHAAGVFNDDTGLRALWHFDEASGINAYDSSGNNYDSVLIQGAKRQINSPAALSSIPLESNKNYKYTVRSLGIGTESAVSNEISITAPDCLPVRAEVVLTPSCDALGTKIGLSWDPDPNTSYWTIYKKRTSQTDAAYTCINCPGTTLNSYSDSNIESNMSYDYYVEAHGSSSSAISDVNTAVAMICYDMPAVPLINTDPGYVCGQETPPANTENTVLPKCAGSASRMEINWAPYDDINTIEYNILRKNVSDGEADFTIIKPKLPYPARTYIDSNVDNAKSYVYKMEAVGSGGESNSVQSEPSLETDTCDCANIKPYIPPWLSLVSASYALGIGGNVEINWTDAQNETHYEIFRRLQGDSEFAFIGNDSQDENILKFFISKATAAYSLPLGMVIAHIDYEDPAPTGYVSFNDLTVEEDMTYEYQVRALNAAGSTDSNIISPVYVPIAPPGNFVLTYENLPSAVKLNWTAAAYSVKGGPPTYTVYRDDNPEFNSAEIICSNIVDFPVDHDNRECTDSDPLPGLAYYRARAVNNSPNYTNSNTVMTISSLRWDETVP